MLRRLRGLAKARSRSRRVSSRETHNRRGKVLKAPDPPKRAGLPELGDLEDAKRVRVRDLAADASVEEETPLPGRKLIGTEEM